MKKVSTLKITKLSKNELSKRQQNRLVGGDRCCICNCSRPIYLTNDNGYDAYGGNNSGYGFYVS